MVDVAQDRSYDLGSGILVSFGKDLSVTFVGPEETLLTLNRGQQERLLVAQSYYP